MRRSHHGYLILAVAAVGLAACNADDKRSTGQPSGRGATAKVQQERGFGDRRPNITALDIKPTLPDKTVTYFDPEHRVRITFPAKWHRARQSLTPRLKEPGGILAVGSNPLSPEPKKACSAAADLPQVELGRTDALVHVGLQAGAGVDGAPNRPRPFELLKQVRPVQSDRPASGQVFPWTCLDRVGIAGLWTVFRADRRVFYVTAVVGEGAPGSTRREVLGVLESLKFGPSAAR